MQKPLRRYFLFFILLLTANCILQTACKFNPDLQGQGQPYLQGEWQQDTVALQKKLVNYSLYHLKFTCDSFFVSINSFTKSSTGADSCIKNGRWSEFAKGHYEQSHDTLRLKGLFCNPNFSYKVEGGCFRSGNYDEFFKLSKKSDSIVQFYPISSVIPFNARLIKRTTCIPKPL